MIVDSYTKKNANLFSQFFIGRNTIYADKNFLSGLATGSKTEKTATVWLSFLLKIVIAAFRCTNKHLSGICMVYIVV